MAHRTVIFRCCRCSNDYTRASCYYSWFYWLPRCRCIWGSCCSAGYYLFTILPAPYFKKWSRHPAIKAVVDGITTAAIGAMAGAFVILAKGQFADVISVLIALATIAILFRFKKVQEPYTNIAAALPGLLLKYWT
jgi:chromate transporter